MRVKVQQIVAFVDSSSAIVTTDEEMLEAVLNLLGHVTQVHELTRTCWTFDLERVTIEHVKPKKRFDQQKVHAKPYRSTPIAVATEESTVRIPGNISHFELLAVDAHGVGVVFVEFRQRSNPVVRQKFSLIEHSFENLFQPLPADQRQKKPVIFATTLHACNVPFGDVIAILYEPIHSSFEGWKHLHELRLESQNSVQRDQPYQRPDRQLLGPRSAPGYRIIVEPSHI